MAVDQFQLVVLALVPYETIGVYFYHHCHGDRSVLTKHMTHASAAHCSKPRCFFSCTKWWCQARGRLQTAKKQPNLNPGQCSGALRQNNSPRGTPRLPGARPRTSPHPPYQRAAVLGVYKVNGGRVVLYRVPYPDRWTLRDIIIRWCQTTNFREISWTFWRGKCSRVRPKTKSSNMNTPTFAQSYMHSRASRPPR